MAFGKPDWRRSSSAGSAFAPPEITSRTEAVSRLENCAPPSSTVCMVGTPIQMVGRKRSKASWIAALPKAGISTQHARASRHVMTPQVIPPTWLSGSATGSTSSASMRQCSTCARAAASCERCVSVAPFGCPVVPDV